MSEQRILHLAEHAGVEDTIEQAIRTVWHEATIAERRRCAGIVGVFATADWDVIKCLERIHAGGER